MLLCDLIPSNSIESHQTFWDSEFFSLHKSFPKKGILNPPQMSGSETSPMYSMVHFT